MYVSCKYTNYVYTCTRHVHREDTCRRKKDDGLRVTAINVIINDGFEEVVTQIMKMSTRSNSYKLAANCFDK